MKANFYPIPARQALAQGVEPKEQVELVESAKDGGAVVMFEDGVFEIVPIIHLQKIKAEPAIKKSVTSKKSS